MTRAWPSLLACLLGVLAAAGAPRAAGAVALDPGAASPGAGAPHAADQAARPRPTHVLVLYAPSRHRGVMVWEEGFWEALAASWRTPVHLHTEYGLEASLAGGEENEADLRNLLQRKYARVPLDVVVPVGAAALDFALRHRAALFGGAPLVFSAVVRDARAGPVAHDVTGVWTSIGWGETVEAALQLQPDTRLVALVSGTSATDRAWTADALARLAPYQHRVALLHLTNLALGEASDRVATLPEQTVIVLGPFLQDAEGRPFVGAEGREHIAAVANAPAYSPIATPGIVGGHLVRFDAHGVATARLVARVLGGERPAPEDGPAGVFTFDARALERWGLDAGRLPPQSVLRSVHASAWQRYRWYLVGASGFLAAQSALIGGLLVQRARRRRVQQALAERLRFEQLLSELSASFVGAAPGALDQAIEGALRRIGEDLALDRVSLLAVGDTAPEIRATHAWSRPEFRQTPAIARGAFPWLAARLARGETIAVSRIEQLPEAAAADRAMLLARGVRSLALVPLMLETTPVGVLACSTRRAQREWHNVMARLALLGQILATALARQRAETALRESHGRIRDLAAQLLRATEEERRRIAREIHDDLSQKIAALGLGIAVLERHLDAAAPAVRRRIAQLHDRIAALGAHTRRLSRDLHPTALQYAGLAAGLREHCAELHGDTGIKVELHLDPSLDALSPDVALCLYRVAQEALANVARHSGADRATVAAAVEGARATLTVQDEGVGFDTAVRRGPGLGLVSMAERVRLIGGTVDVHSGPGRGTVVQAVIPLADAPPVAPAS